MILVHGHRGAKARMPENTLAGFEYAIQSGADAVELDVVVTQDGELAISHDPIVERGHAPSLDEVFGLANLGRFSYDVEIKIWFGPPPCPGPSQFASLVLEKIRAHGLETRVNVMSFDFRVIAALRGHAPEIRLSALTEHDPRPFSEIASIAGDADIVAPHFLLVTLDKVAAAHADDLQVVPWTVNEPSDWDRMIAAEVDGIITDDPAALVAHLISRGLRSAATQP